MIILDNGKFPVTIDNLSRKLSPLVTVTRDSEERTGSVMCNVTRTADTDNHEQMIASLIGSSALMAQYYPLREILCLAQLKIWAMFL